ncbi:MAG: class I SAM-dependent rRNA methyltransferase [Anaerolineae bacterium]|nr:class I SAM-dependent rRNA methyltransferase [Anaerolineae bacterium]
MSLPTIYLPHHLGKQLDLGHPWIYRDRIVSAARDESRGGPRLSSGTWVKVQCGKRVLYGLWDDRGSIAVRLFSRQQVPDAHWVRDRIDRAWQMRAPLWQDRGHLSEGTTAFRVLYGEGDGMPGVVVDLYNDYAVLQSYTDSLDVIVPWVVEGLRDCIDLKGVLRRDPSGRVQTLWGRSPGPEVIVQENGLRLGVNLIAGQKTGLFLDHRENRQYLEAWCKSKRILNCFAYTGAFSLYAIRGGASEVTGVDIAPQTAEATRRNFELNGFEPDAHPVIVADCFDLLEQYASQDRSFDLIILDPPSLAQSKKSRHAAIRAYTRLNQLAMCCLPPGGHLATASCTSQVSPQAFRDLLGEASARAGKRFLILHEAGHAIDHPVPAHFPEGRYLKFVFGQVEGAI